MKYIYIYISFGASFFDAESLLRLLTLLYLTSGNENEKSASEILVRVKMNDSLNRKIDMIVNRDGVMYKW